MKLDTPNTTSRAQIIEILRTFKNENAENYGIESMALFGSVARGEQNENSDVDLLIKFKSPSLYLYAELSDALETILVGHHQIRHTSTHLADKKIVRTNRWCTGVFPADVEACAYPYQQQPSQGCRDRPEFQENFHIDNKPVFSLLELIIPVQ